MKDSCPYNAQPASAKWREAVAKVGPEATDPTVPTSIGISRQTVVASAGSCFAQHIRNHLVRRGYNYLITEPAPEVLSPEERDERNYSVYPARFGNVYTTVQLLQLFKRAFGDFIPQDDYWTEGDRYFDPFRPFIEPDGFVSAEALHEDRAFQLAATRRMFEQVEVFVFTLGLTEAWCSRTDRAVFPVCPGCGAGTFNPDRYEFVNFTVQQTSDALGSFIDAFTAVNPKAKIILTVSPVPLMATMTSDHVLSATTYSKSVLRVAAEEARRNFPCVDYFPSYEIIMGTRRTHEFFAGDSRTITPAGVKRVMDLFFQTYGGEIAPTPNRERVDGDEAQVEGVVCDEETVLRLIGA